MNARCHHCRIELSDFLERIWGIAGNDFDDRRERVLFITRIDTFGRVTDKKVFFPF